MDNLLTILPTLEEHHGDLTGDAFSFPAGFVLAAVGLAPTKAVVSALRNLGFSAFVETADGFNTSK